MSRRAPLVWIRSPDREAFGLVDAIQDQLVETFDDISSYVTVPGDIDESDAALDKFWSDETPDLLLNIGVALRTSLLGRCQTANVPIITVNTANSTFGQIAPGWIPSKRRALLSKVSMIFTKDPEVRATLIKSGVPSAHIRLLEDLQDVPDVLDHDEDERRALAQRIGPRPVWLAADIPPEEVDAVIAAHKEATRRTHRLLLVFTASAYALDALARLKAAGLNTCTSDTLDSLGDATQVIFSDGNDELGLWYRLAPMTYCGGTLSTGLCIDPFHPAALGSAVIHGTRIGRNEESYNRLTRAAATYRITSADQLGGAVSLLLSADKTARLANAGWDITSRGAAARAEVIAFVGKLLAGEA